MNFERYKNLSEDEKQKLVEYRKNIIEWEKMLYHNYKQIFQFDYLIIIQFQNYKNKYKKHLSFVLMFDTILQNTWNLTVGTFD